MDAVQHRGHELGHTLGFRTSTRVPSRRFEDNNWRPLTPYDSASIMHYPQCNGSSRPPEHDRVRPDGAQALALRLEPALLSDSGPHSALPPQ